MLDYTFFRTPLNIARGVIWLINLVFLSSLPIIIVFYPRFLGAEPVTELLHLTGKWGLFCLLLTLSITPLQYLFKKYDLNFPKLILLRRLLGLWSFCYFLLHFLVYFIFDLALDFMDLNQDLQKRPFILLGFLGFILLIPLAVTSTQAWQRKLKKNWKKLHNIIYIMLIIGLTHFIMANKTLYKGDFSGPILYLIFAIILLGFRVLPKIQAFRAKLKS